MDRKWWILLILALIAVGCLVVAGVGALWSVNNIPGVARLVRGDPATAVPVATLRPTFTPMLNTATLTPAPTTTPTWTPTATVPPEPTAISTDGAVEVTALPSATTPPSPTLLPLTPTIEPPTATAAPPTATPRPQWIAFETGRGELGQYEVFVVAPDGTRLQNLTNGWADDVAPVWSPDGRSIAFVSFRDTLAGKWSLGPGSLYIADFDPVAGASGGNTIRLTDDGGSDGWPTWAPKGQRLAFESDRSGNWDIWVINRDGSGLVNLTQSPENERYPAWSPDGKKLAFTTKRSGSWNVWVMGADGSNPANLTKTPDRDRYAMWSPDGKKIAFNTSRDGNQEIYVMNADGSNPINVSNAPDSVEGLADWSPDGKRLVLYSDRPGNKDLFIVDLTSGKWTNITKHPASDEFCTWSP